MLRGPKYKICKRVGGMVFPQCQSPKYTASLNKEAFGGKKRKGKPRSEYGIQFIEKQKAKFTYGLTERQFHNYVTKAQETKKSNPAAVLSQLLERRLDNVAFRLGLASSRAAGRQMVSHGHIKINGRRVTVASYEVSIGDKIAIRKESAAKGIFKDIKTKKNIKSPKWIKFDYETLEGQVVSLPEPMDGDQTLRLNTVSEFYSRT